MIAVSSAYNASSTWRDGTGMSLTYRLNKTGETSPPPLRHASPHATKGRCGRLEGRLERSVVKASEYSFNQVGGEFEGR
jgi:hypothetical protein